MTLEEKNTLEKMKEIKKAVNYDYYLRASQYLDEIFSRNGRLYAFGLREKRYLIIRNQNSELRKLLCLLSGRETRILEELKRSPKDYNSNYYSEASRFLKSIFRGQRLYSLLINFNCQHVKLPISIRLMHSCSIVKKRYAFGLYQRRFLIIRNKSSDLKKLLCKLSGRETRILEQKKKSPKGLKLNYYLEASKYLECIFRGYRFVGLLNNFECQKARLPISIRLMKY
uniref:Uncharacterized protein n=1 Tax=Strongyloides stercoralis TaxID=6248 RepID=A0AAF5CTN3_STRER